MTTRDIAEAIGVTQGAVQALRHQGGDLARGDAAGARDAAGPPQAAALSTLEQAASAGRLARDLDVQAAATAFVGLIQGLVMQPMLGGRSARRVAVASRGLLIGVTRSMAGVYRGMVDEARALLANSGPT